MKEQLTTLKERFGSVPNESGLIKEMRAHQGWWRANVLNQEAGAHPISANKNICSTILNGEKTGHNFLTDNTHDTVKKMLSSRTNGHLGMIETGRLYNNLLSSQPLCFNFFGELAADKTFGLAVLQLFYPALTNLRELHFEFAPPEHYTRDGSAFDVAFEVEIGDKIGLIGWECKYTDSFSFKASNAAEFYGKIGSKNYKTYLDIYNNSAVNFKNIYTDFVGSKSFNQLFRNQLIAEAALQNQKYNFVYTGLFCYQGDKDAIKIGHDFQQMLTNTQDFQVITYQDFIAKIQQLNINWQQREWTMLLWARYCATILSRETTEAVAKKNL